MKLTVLSLKTFNDRSILSFDLTGKLTDYFNHQSNTLEIKLDTGTIRLNKFEYLNKAKIYQCPINPKMFFMIFGYKKINEKEAFKILMRYAVSKVDNSISEIESKRSNLFQIKSKLLKEIAA